METRFEKVRATFLIKQKHGKEANSVSVKFSGRESPNLSTKVHYLPVHKNTFRSHYSNNRDKKKTLNNTRFAAALNSKPVHYLISNYI